MKRALGHQSNLISYTRRNYCSSTRSPNYEKSSSRGIREFFSKITTMTIPAAVGFGVIGVLHWQHRSNSSNSNSVANDQQKESKFSNAILRIPGHLTQEEHQMATQRQMDAMNILPYRTASRLWGFIHDIPLPIWARKPLYSLWTIVFGCNLDEMKYPIESYLNLGEFFSRPLKENVRTIESNPLALASPVDGRVSIFGSVENTEVVPLLEQIKGARYRLDDFLGGLPSFYEKTSSQVAKPKTKLFHCVLYLAPGDYHRIHAPTDWNVEERRHFPGKLYPVSQWAAKLIPSLFALNERVVLLGKWQFGDMAMAAVGATNVGSIAINFEPELQTNVKGQGSQLGKCFSRLYDQPIHAIRGEEVAQFKLGSTVVLIFEAPESFTFTIKEGDRIKLGEMLGKIECGPMNENSNHEEVQETMKMYPALTKPTPIQKESPSSSSSMVHSIQDEQNLLTTPTLSRNEQLASNIQNLGPAYSRSRN